MSDIKDRLLAACNGHPTAAIPWPHRLLHDAIDQIEAQQARIAELEEGIRTHHTEIRKTCSDGGPDQRLWARLSGGDQGVVDRLG